ncbi:MAG: hypothetical protein IT350_21330 [Deltaproteobacteria bacterium]|nr:hypothetical protein [Deltaproteobacteria bacterium]
MKTAIRFCLCAAILATLPACSATGVNPDRLYEGSYESYRDVYEEWTRAGKIYHNFDTELVVDATMYSKVFRDALRGETARAEALPANDVAKMQKRDEEELGRVVKVFVSAYMPRREWNNLADAKSPSFRFWLVDADGRRARPERIEEIKLKRRADVLYKPQVHPWARNYAIEFPAHDENGQALRLSGGAVKLHVTGVQGQADLVWDIP